MISKQVIKELRSVRRVLHYLPTSPSTENGWSRQEQQLFWIALDRFPRGPWTVIAECIRTKSTRQAMTHGQKLRQKLKRWNVRLRRNPIASSLLDDGAVTTSANVSVTTAISVGTPTANSDATLLAELPEHVLLPAQMMRTPTRREMREYEGQDAVCLVTESKEPACHHDSCSKPASKNSSTSATTREHLSMLAPGGSTHKPADLQILFDPRTSASVTAATTAISMPNMSEITSGASYHAAAVPYPVGRDHLCAQSLLDELVDAVWDDDLRERS